MSNKRFCSDNHVMLQYSDSHHILHTWKLILKHKINLKNLLNKLIVHSGVCSHNISVFDCIHFSIMLHYRNGLSRWWVEEVFWSSATKLNLGSLDLDRSLDLGSVHLVIILWVIKTVIRPSAMFLSLCRTSVLSDRCFSDHFPDQSTFCLVTQFGQTADFD